MFLARQRCAPKQRCGRQAACGAKRFHAETRGTRRKQAVSAFSAPPREKRPCSDLMAVDETNAGHSRKVAVERPNLCAVVGGNRCNQKVGETKPLPCRPGEVQPVLDACPRLILWKENRKCREDATE